jgi:2-oxoglutarate ferredoxin oxidoreductase subunit alpha
MFTGNDAVGEGAIRNGCDCYFGYPITPQNELTAYMALHMPAHDRIFIQAESEVAAINMVLGAAAAGKRAMTSSSSPGVSLKQEGISYLAGAQLPAVIVNIQRSGPGLGGIDPSQADYWQATRGGGHGDYRTIVLAPAGVQEMHDLTAEAFDLADRFRMPAVVLSDGRIGQMMEPITLRDPNTGPPADLPAKDWALTGAAGRPRNLLRSYYGVTAELVENNQRIQASIEAAEQYCVKYDDYLTEDADLLLVGYGTSARICRQAARDLRSAGKRVGVFRPISLWPFPSSALVEAAETAKAVLVVEMSAGQMVEDVRLSLNGSRPVELVSFIGGEDPMVATVRARAEELSKRL